MRKLTLKLTRRADGRVCKRVDSRLRIWPDEESARRELFALIALREDPTAALAIAPEGPQVVTIRDVCNGFIADRETRMKDERIESGTFLDYKTAIDEFIASIEAWKPETPDPVSLLGRNAPVAMLQPIHFRHVRARWASRLGAWKVDNRIQGVRTAFKWAVEPARLIPGPPRYGDEFHKPTKADKRADKRAREAEHGEHRFGPAELRSILSADQCRGAMKCFVLLGLNGGMYSADCAVLRWSDVRREGRSWVVDTYREKTGIRQKCPLWPETVAALEAWRPLRPEPKDKANGDLVFVTVHGNPWTSENVTRDDKGRVKGGGETDSIKLTFGRMLTALGIKRRGVGFGAFRHTHISATGSHEDLNARKVVRGHKIDGIEEHYDFTDLSRLKSVTDLARAKLLLPAVSSKKPRQVLAGTTRSTGPRGTARRSVPVARPA